MATFVLIHRGTALEMGAKIASVSKNPKADLSSTPVITKVHHTDKDFLLGKIVLMKIAYDSTKID